LKARIQGGTLLVPSAPTENAFERAATRTRVFRASFPMILDDFVLRDFVLNLALMMAAMLMVLLVATVFELFGDILRNHVSTLTVGEYLLNVTPYFLYNSAQYGVLL